MKITKKEIKQIIKEEISKINESSLSRLYKHMLEHDTAIFTGFRNDVDDVSNCTEKAVEPGIPNDIRNRDIKAYLLSKGCGVTKVDGSYIEDFETPQAVEVSEDSLFVVNLTDNPHFFNTVIALGEKYCQDSVLIIPKGLEKPAYLVGTNKSSFPGYGNKIDIGSPKFGKDAQFMTKVRGRPVTLAEDTLETVRSYSFMGRWAIDTIAKKVIL